MNVTLEPHHGTIKAVFLRPHPWLGHDRRVAFIDGSLDKFGWTQDCELSASQKQIVLTQLVKVLDGTDD